MARVQLNIDEDLWKTARAKAFSDGLSGSALVQIALAQFLQWSPKNQTRVIGGAQVSDNLDRKVFPAGGPESIESVTLQADGKAATFREPTRPNPTVDDFGTPVDPAYRQFRPVPKTARKR